MKKIRFYFDFISPYAYLAFEQLPGTLEGVSYSVSHIPVLFAGMLKHHGQLGPAEIAPKRDWTYRHVQWLADSQGIELQLPKSHPFNPLALLRMAVASEPDGLPSRHVCETLFHHVWRGGSEAADRERLQAVCAQLGLADLAGSEEVKARLKAHTDAAIALGVFGVPTFEVDGKLFWGFDALPMLRAYLLGDSGFQQRWDAAGAVDRGTSRR